MLRWPAVGVAGRLGRRAGADEQSAMAARTPWASLARALGLAEQGRRGLHGGSARTQPSGNGEARDETREHRQTTRCGKKMEMKKDREGSELTGNEEVAEDGGLNGVGREARG